MTRPPVPAVAITTLGCKLNQYESEQIREQFLRMGCRSVPFEGRADVYIINSCTVTARTDREGRRLIRRAKRLNPEGFVVITGCYAQVSPEVLAEIPEADLVAPNADKESIAARVRERLGDRFTWGGPPLDAGPEGCAGSVFVEEFAGHTRAFVKVQEGCNWQCAYCIIPRARGRSRSTPQAEVMEQVRRLADAGHPEVVLIGTHLGQYGVDIPGAPDLAGLVEQVCEIPGVRRVRLSSIEPGEVTDRLVDLVAHHPQVCRHLHMPLQHGCDSVLQRMNRPYSAAFFRELALRIMAADPGICIGTDVIVGFPGETEAEFSICREFIADLPLAYLHVFTYSVRPGTPAATMPDQVAAEVKLARNHELRDLSEAKRAAFAQSMVGRTVAAVLERVEGEVIDGLTDNYLRIRIPTPGPSPGAIVPVRVTAAHEGELTGALHVPPEVG